MLSLHLLFQKKARPFSPREKESCSTLCFQLGNATDLHARGPIHETEDEDGVDDEHEEQEDGLVEVVELDEGRQ